MKRREQISQETRVERDKKILKDYQDIGENGKFTMSIKQLAEKYSISVPLVYKILAKHDK